MGRLVNDLLTLARSDEIDQEMRANDYKKGDLRKSVIDLDSLLLQVYRQFRQTSERENGNKMQQGPRLMLQNITPVKVFGDADQLHQVLVALIDNALKYTPYEGCVILSLTIDKNEAVLTQVSVFFLKTSLTFSSASTVLIALAPVIAGAPV